MSTHQENPVSSRDSAGVGSALCLAPVGLSASLPPVFVPSKGEGELRGLAYPGETTAFPAAPSAAEAMSKKIRAELDAS
jgi:hypothetical protein